MDKYYSNILSTLDKHAKEMLFPYPANSEMPCVNMRLTALRKDTQWTLFFETIAYSISQGSFNNIIYGYGNNLKKENGILAAVHIITPSTASSFWDDDMSFRLDRYQFEISINGKSKKFSLSDKDYSNAGLLGEIQLIPELEFLILMYY